ncbi:nitroreductase family deazaflavin-dependent oxidoreductase [Paractinoplanes lichenicola]|uniref:Nitroreductase family deazaflavin-dependent oxidoreductase n=1 Tax=Paractinoplanes lichenicola TaxID=2802976 RepID=A0ABS1VV84_9ACTN|nr:nitroreductase family deazaflavin-dependent oxidoreductase [Actinoplanes lichenicola]MBL7258375.1 nitroreductase family deazaflavin-dependent oxidoreductase [Actinoplanes lichenicola]
MPARMSGYAFTEAGPLRRLVRLAVTSRPLAWLSVRYLAPIDRLALRATGGRGTFSGWVSGLPVVQLTTTGARTGQRRTTPVLGVPDGDGLVVIAANFGETRHPAWYHNLRAHPQATVTHGATRRDFTAVELEGEDRDRRFAAAVRMNPGWLRFRSRAGARQIPVLRLTPA